NRKQRNIEMAINAGMIDRLDYKQVEGHLDSGIRAGYISPEKGNSVLKQFAVRSKEEADEASVITAVQNGDFTALRDIGVSQSEAAKKFVGYHVEKASGMEDPEDRVSVYENIMKTAQDTGNTHILKEVGEQLAPVVTSFQTSPEGRIDPMTQELFSMFTYKLD